MNPNPYLCEKCYTVFESVGHATKPCPFCKEESDHSSISIEHGKVLVSSEKFTEVTNDMIRYREALNKLSSSYRNAGQNHRKEPTLPLQTIWKGEEIIREALNPKEGIK